MLTVDRIAKVDSILGALLATLYRAIERIGDKHEALIVNAAYKVAEAKAVAIGKAEDKISDLEDARSELAAHVAEATALLAAKHKAALAALGQEVAVQQEKLRADLATAAEARIAAGKAYDATIREADEKLDVKVEA